MKIPEIPDLEIIEYKEEPYGRESLKCTILTDRQINRDEAETIQEIVFHKNPIGYGFYKLEQKEVQINPKRFQSYWLCGRSAN